MKKHYLLISFTVILLSFTCIDIFTKDKAFSEFENRKLSEKVNFTVKDFIDGSFQEDYESYVNDQFILRDKWINLKSISEYALGKIENNGIIYGDNNYLFEKFDKFNRERLEKNINSIKLFSEKYKDLVSFMIVPSSYEIYKENLPIGSPVIEQEYIVNNIYKQLNSSKNINVFNILKENKNNYIYYKTDHHWTSYGAYLAYCGFINSINESKVDINTLNKIDLYDFYGTYFSKAKPFNIKGDILTYFELKNITMDIGENHYNTIYDFSKIENRDKYSLFLNGNNGLTVIKNNNLNNGKRILVIKDSFANSFIPFLTYNYEEIHVIDLRHYVYDLSKYIDQNNFDNILVLYNFINLSTDNNLIKIKY